MNELNQGDRFASAPIARLIGFQIQPGNPGEAIVLLAVDERLHNPMGQVHGGVIAALSDTAMGIAFGRTLDDRQDFATIDLHIHFMRPVRGKMLTATAKVQQRGLRIGYVGCTIVDDQKRLIASASCACTTSDL